MVCFGSDLRMYYVLRCCVVCLLWFAYLCEGKTFVGNLKITARWRDAKNGGNFVFVFDKKSVFLIPRKRDFFSSAPFCFANSYFCTKCSFFRVPDCKIEGKTSAFGRGRICEIWILLGNVVSLYYRKGEPLGFPLFLP